MKKLRAYLTFHKSTIILNLVVSLTFSLVWLPFFVRIFPSLYMTAGTLVSLFYKEVSNKNEYYFYNNLGITRVSLITVNVALNIITGLIFMWVLNHVVNT